MRSGTHKARTRTPARTPVLSVRHDVLYSKARYVLNQRHIKRPWFNLNPFLERTDESVDLENYLPEESKYIQPLESLVLCESYRNEHPVDTRELDVERFFDYLYSDLWSGGCSVRVLEGQLLNQLLICLYRMEKHGTVVRHTTYAFARNKRPRTGCYKLADKAAYGYIEDTLLVEFAYFGHLTKRRPNPKTQNPLEYLRLRIPEFADDSQPPTLSPSLDEIPKRKKATNVSLDIRSINSQLPEVNLDLHKNERGGGRRYSLMSKPVNTIRFIQSLKPKQRRFSLMDSSTSSGTPVSVLHGYSGDNEHAAIPEESHSSKGCGLEHRLNEVDPKQLLKKFPMHKYLKRVDPETSTEEKESEKDKVDEEERFFGEELYLSDEKVRLVKEPETVKAKLQRKKAELHERRKERKEIVEARKKSQDRPVLPPLPPLDVDKIPRQDVMHCTINMPEELPTFEQFIKLLKEDELYDPRYRNKVRLKSKRIAQRYYMAKGQRRNSNTFDCNVFPGSLLDSSHQVRVRQRTRRQSNSSDYGIRLTIRRPTLQQSSKGLPKLSELGLPKLSELPDSPTADPDRARHGIDPADIADEVLGVTDSEPCRRHCLAMIGSFNKAHGDKTTARHDDKTTARHDDKTTARHDDKTTARHQENVLSVPRRSVTAYARAVVDKSKSELNSSPSRDLRLSKSPLPPIFPKAPLCEEESENPDTDSEETDADDETTSFDAGKLNIKYSIERLRKKQKRKKKKPAFHDILAKYYKMQDALTAFRKGSMTREIKNAKERSKRLNLAGFFRGNKMAFKPIDDFVLGKMKKFNFLDTYSKRCRNLDKLSRADFAVPCLGAFLTRLNGALQDFVVRREIVVSDLPTYYKSATSVTFTRKSCFANKHENC